MKKASDSPLEIGGLPVSPGQVATRICLYSHKNYQQAALRIRKKEMSIENEISRYKEAIAYCEKAIIAVRKKVDKEIGSAEAAVFDAQLAMLKDPSMTKKVNDKISKENLPFENAVEEVLSSYERMFAELDDAYLQERSSDISEIKRRLLNFGYETEPGFVCSGFKRCGRGFHSIIVAEELTSEMLMEIDLSTIYGIITEKGGINGHAAILTRAAGIPAVTGVKGAMDIARCGNSVYLDGNTGEVIFNPNNSLLKKYKHARKKEVTTVEESLPGVTVLANCSSVETAQEAQIKHADGIGLFRTEMLFLHKGSLLNEKEQIEHYSSTCRALKGKEVTFRLLDIGGDKPLPSLEIGSEENPFLGYRGARFLLGHREILQTQLRALLTTALKYPLNIMLPMIVDIEQLKELKAEIQQISVELSVPNEQYKIGLVFEVPSAIFQAEELLNEVDFGSIGSNDLTQYLLAVDRNNDLVAVDYNNDHPALWRSMQIIADAAKKTGRRISICGELASFPGYAKRLFELGICALSVSPHMIAQVRQELNNAVKSIE